MKTIKNLFKKPFPAFIIIPFLLIVFILGFFCGQRYQDRKISLIKINNEQHASESHIETEDRHGDTPNDEEIKIASSAQKLIGLSTVPVVKKPFYKYLEITGSISPDPLKTAAVQSPGNGVIERCFVGVGSIVKQGDPLCRIKELNDNNAQILYAPSSGIIMSASLSEGKTIDTITTLHSIADIEELGAVFDIYERDIEYIKNGQSFIVRSSGAPGIDFKAHVTFISPRIDEDSRTIKVRAQVINSGYKLRLGMFISALIPGEMLGNQLVVPERSIQTAGGRNLIFVREGDEHFLVMPVRLIASSAGFTAIEGAIKNGAEVAVDGTPFLLAEFLKSELVDEHKH
ncbi:MAG: hypothetical protein A2096_15400 [Spirochaetes bacterium GWF1_41_5]|nr:MAG: hypothetical protein A2096_15400 [Spirochaetes bacterium GWF1_41_5]HBE01078.1 hypothetical protein [Spirochaetia bacterium]